MFNNANVLYKTKFVDGVSTVTRYVQHSKTGSVSSSTADKENSHTIKKKQQTAKRTRLEWGRNGRLPNIHDLIVQKSDQVRNSASRESSVRGAPRLCSDLCWRYCYLCFTDIKEVVINLFYIYISNSGFPKIRMYTSNVRNKINEHIEF